MHHSLPFSRKFRQVKSLLKRLKNSDNNQSSEYWNLTKKLKQMIVRLQGAVNFSLLKKYLGASLCAFLISINTTQAQTNIFAPPIVNPFGLSASIWDDETVSHKFQDLDNDGDLDLIVMKDGNKCYTNYYDQDSSIIYFLENVGDINEADFELDTAITTPIFLDDVYSMNFLDIDDDGDTDLLISGDGNLFSCESYIGSYTYPTNYYIENVGNISDPEFSFVQIPSFLYQFLGGIRIDFNLFSFGYGEIVDIDENGDLDYIGTTATNIYGTDILLNPVYFKDISLGSDTILCDEVSIITSVLETPIDYDDITIESTTNYCAELAADDPVWLSSSDRINMFDYNDDGLKDIISGYNLWSNDTIKVYQQNNLSTADSVHFDSKELLGWLIRPATYVSRSFKDFDNDGDVDVFMIDEDGITYYSENLTIDLTTNIYQQQQIDLAIFPNPASDQVQLSFKNEEGALYTIRILDLKGSLLKETNTTSNQTYLNISALSKGIYIVEISSDDQFASKKLVIE